MIEWIGFGDDLVCVVVFEYDCLIVRKYQYYWYVDGVVFDLIECVIKVGVFDDL